MICCYCGTENQENNSCSFCEAPLDFDRPIRKNFVYLEQCEQPFSQLKLFHTYDLLVLLRLVRKERSDAFNQMRLIKKGAQEAQMDQETISFAEEQYLYYTKRAKVLEGILIDRMGYKPKTINDRLLISIDQKIKEYEKKA
ncbi:hypothetical protein A4U60_17755 (plasmid) [Priestia endophytica]|nr:hypothetical protein A4U60_17755 [Priestia endophytica]